MLRGHTASIMQVMLDQTGTRIISAAGDRTVRIWSLETGLQCGVLKVSAAAQGVQVMHWDVREQALCGFDFRGQMHVWQTAYREPDNVQLRD